MKIKRLFVLEHSDLLRMRAGEMLQPTEDIIVTVDPSLLGRQKRPKQDGHIIEHAGTEPRSKRIPTASLGGGLQCPLCPRVLAGQPALRGHLSAHSQGRARK